MKGYGKKPCRFGSACTRAGCWYEHPAGHEVAVAEPIRCRYGLSCTRRDCRFEHPLGHAVAAAAASHNDELEDDVCRAYDETDDRVCVWFQKGRCRNGSSCKYQHIQQERDGNVIVVRDLDKSLTSSNLDFQVRQFFQRYGYISKVQIKTDLDRRCRGFAFVVFADADSVEAAMQCDHPTWDIKRKNTLGMYVEGDVRTDRKTKALAQGAAHPSMPFSKTDRVLLLGEGNFSYALAAVKGGFLDASRTMATSCEPPRDDSYLKTLRSVGMHCLTDVDATRLAMDDLFDVIVFNFPHNGEPSIERSQDLIRNLFRSARAVLQRGGHVAISLKQTWPYSEWNVEECAAASGFCLQKAYGFPVAQLQRHGYEHALTDNIPHQVSHLESAKTFEFLVSAISQ